VNVAPPPTQPRAPEFDIDVLAKHLPAKQRRELLAQRPPLAEEELPEPEDLSGFWLRAEGAVRSLHLSLDDLNKLGEAHMRQLAPVLLGARGWLHYQRTTFYNWNHFKGQVSNDFGLSEAQLNARFFGMYPKEGEASANFVLRVEQQRRQLDAHEDATLHCFKARLDPHMQHEVEVARKAKLAANGQ
jgi:hypothetical protein